jgi:hypothetical protein
MESGETLKREPKLAKEPPPRNLRTSPGKDILTTMKLLLFLILLIVCWPAALLALVLYPMVWLLLLPFRLVGLVVHGIFDLIAALFTLPARALRAI